jgi:hypothetical protein
MAILSVPTEKGGFSFQGVAGNLRPDCFFTATQQQRLLELMGRWRTAQGQGADLPPNEKAELEALVETELRASADRAALAVEIVR